MTLGNMRANGVVRSARWSGALFPASPMHSCPGNRLWGASRIHGELLMLGFDAHRSKPQLSSGRFQRQTAHHINTSKLDDRPGILAQMLGGAPYQRFSGC